jgi:hypothetical protein
MSPQEMIARGALGKMNGNGQGFYTWSAGRPVEPNPDVKSVAQVIALSRDVLLMFLLLLLLLSLLLSLLFWLFPSGSLSAPILLFCPSFPAHWASFTHNASGCAQPSCTGEGPGARHTVHTAVGPIAVPHSPSPPSMPQLEFEQLKDIIVLSMVNGAMTLFIEVFDHRNIDVC